MAREQRTEKAHGEAEGHAGLIGLHHVRFIEASVFYSFARRGAGHGRDADVIIRSAGMDLPSTVSPNNASTKACGEMGPAHRSSSGLVV